MNEVGLLNGNVALIAGGARGIGAEEARLFCAQGATVVITDVRDEQGEQLAAELPHAEFAHLDVTSESDWETVVGQTLDRYGRLDAFVNNAGIYTGRRIVNVSLDEWHKMIAVNQTGVFLGLRAVGRAMTMAGNGGAMVNVSSVAGLQASWGGISYCATKWAVRAMSRVAAKEFGSDGIRVNSIYPGYIQTDLLDFAIRKLDRTQIVDSVPLGRIGDASEVATVALFLVTPMSSYCNGQEFVVDGGLFG